MIIYEELTLNNITEHNNNKIVIQKNGVKFHFSLALKNQYESAVIFSNGAINREKKNPPIYMRSSWAEDVTSNCIFIDDPTIHNSNLSIGWGIGRPDHYYLNDISLIIRKILSLYGIEDEKVMYYGSSAGGTMSLLLGSKHIGSKVLVNNPQMRTDKFLSGRTICDIRETFFENYSEDEFFNEFKERLSVPYAFKNNQHIPQTIYLFNRKAYGDFEIQFKSFIEDMKDLELELDRINIIMYNDDKLGHNPINKDSSISYINTYLENKHLWI